MPAEDKPMSAEDDILRRQFRELVAGPEHHIILILQIMMTNGLVQPEQLLKVLLRAEQTSTRPRIETGFIKRVREGLWGPNNRRLGATRLQARRRGIYAYPIGLLSRSGVQAS